MDPPFQVRSILAYNSEHEDDLSFAAGEIITVTEIETDDWYIGTLNGRLGMFPKTFVTIESPKPVEPVLLPPASKTQTESAPVKEAESVAGADMPESQSAPLPTPAAVPAASLSPVTKDHTVVKPPVPSVPLPMPNTHRKEDPYAINKQFIGAGKSTYIPPVKPRDQSNVVHGFHDVAENSEIFREQTEHKEEEDAGPQVSVKERIALLRKKQQEEIEKAAARQKKKDEQKAAKAASLKNQNTASLLESMPPSLVSATSTGSVGDVESEAGLDMSKKDSSTAEQSHATEKQRTLSTEGTVNEDTNMHFVPVTAPKDIDDGDAKSEPSETEEAEEATRATVDETEHHKDDEGEGGAEEDEEGEEDEDEEDEEEAKRRRLVERMAKISGGRNMFGMMGMSTPFAAPQKESSKPKRSNLLKKTSSTQENPTSPTSAPSVPMVPPLAMPLPGMAQPLRQAQPEASNTVANDDLSDQGESDDNLDFVHVEAASEANEDLEPQDTKLSSYPESVSSPRRSIDATRLEESVLEGEATGYEADEDVSDRGGLVTQEEELPPASNRVPTHKLPPPPPSSDSLRAPPPIGVSMPPPPPPHSSVPPIPRTPAVPPVPPTSSVPPANSAPPVPSCIPPIPSEAPPVPASPPQTKYAPPPNPLMSLAQTEKSISSAAGLSMKTLSADGVVNDFEASYDTGLSYSEPPRQFNTTKAKTFSNHVSYAEPDAPPRRRSSVHDGLRRSFSLGRKSLTSSIRSDSDLIEKDLEDIKRELSDPANSSGWWIEDKLPELYSSKRIEVQFEVDTNEVQKRHHRNVIYKDFYILYSDLSQIVLELQFDQKRPRESVHLNGSRIVRAPPIQEGALKEQGDAVGSLVIKTAKGLIGSQNKESIVNIIFDLLDCEASVLQPVGKKSFGVVIYKAGSHLVATYASIMPGDIVCMKNAKFASPKDLTVGETSLYSSVVVAYHPENNLIQVIEDDKDGSVSTGNYKLGELKSGQVRIFRVVEREYVGWD